MYLMFDSQFFWFHKTFLIVIVLPCSSKFYFDAILTQSGLGYKHNIVVGEHRELFRSSLDYTQIFQKT